MLTVKRVERLRTKGRYYDGRKHPAVPGLCLQVSESGAKSWLLRYQLNGVKRWMGLGSLSAFTLVEARERARRERQKLADGIDPLQVRRAERAAQRAAAAKAITFKEAAIQFHKLHEHEWRNRKHAAQVITTLETYAFGVIGDMNVAEVDTPDVLRVIEPIWINKTETASRVRGRIEAVLGWATVRGYRVGDNPARWPQHLDQALPKRNLVKKTEHHPALPYAELPAFMQQLRKREGMAARALEFTILTCARVGETTGAPWNGEIDFGKKIWTVPGSRMKGGKEHKVPLALETIRLLQGLYREGGDDGFVFIGARQGTKLSNTSLHALLKRMGHGEVTVHGFRSTFRDWSAETTNFPREVCELALAHAVGDKVERAYQRGDLLKKRRQLAESWSRYCMSLPTVKGGTVVPIHARGSAR
jgi:integrase